MAIDREATLKNAEKFLRVGRLDGAIAEYAKVVEEYPRDWTTANTLGDLYLRAAQSDRAVALYQRIADHLLAEGFYPKAAALLKKILKITPDDEKAQLHLAEIAARQGLLAEARGYLTGVATRRRQKGDGSGADDIVLRLGSLDPTDFPARAAAARVHEQRGDRQAAARIYREMHDDLAEKGRVEDAIAALRDCLRCDPAFRDPALLLPLVSAELKAGNLEAARPMLPEVLALGASARDGILGLAWQLADGRTEAAAVCVEALADHWIAEEEYADAAAILQEFAARVPGQVQALLRLVEVCVDGGLEATMYEAQAQLADAYLACGRPLEARIIAEDLVSREPSDATHAERLRQALTALGVEDVEAALADRLRHATQPAPMDFNELAFEEPGGEAGRCPEIDAPAGQVQTQVPVPPLEVMDEVMVAEIDLSTVLGELDVETPPLPAPRTQDLEEVFANLRAGSEPAARADDSSDHLDLARTYLDLGMPDEAIGSLESAARAPRCRFEAGSMLAALYRRRGDMERAIEWYERAAEAPAPSGDDARALLYDLGEVLETAGETARALAIFMEIDAEDPGFRDVSARVQRLSKVEAGG